MNEYIGFISNMYEVCIDENQPIVRCCDCAYICNREYANGLEFHTCSYFDSEHVEVEPDGFCKWGVKKKPTDAVREFAQRYERRIAELEELIARQGKHIVELEDKLSETRTERTCMPTESGRCLHGTDCPAWLCSECGELFEQGTNFCSNCGAKVIEEKGKGNDGE